MPVLDAIQSARQRGASDEQILQELQRQNPEKQAVFQQAVKRGAGASQILDEVLTQNGGRSAQDQAARIEKARSEANAAEAAIPHGPLQAASNVVKNVLPDALQTAWDTGKSILSTPAMLPEILKSAWGAGKENVNPLDVVKEL